MAFKHVYATLSCMSRKATKKAKSYRTLFAGRSRFVLAAVVVVGISLFGSYVVLRSHADTIDTSGDRQIDAPGGASGVFNDYPSMVADGSDLGFDPSKPRSLNPIESARVGEQILPTFSLVVNNNPYPSQPFTVIVEFLYPSKSLSLSGIICDSAQYCKTVSWPNWSDSYGFNADRKFSVCVDGQNRNFLNRQRLFTPQFSVINNSSQFLLSESARIYLNASCDSNEGHSNQYYSKNNNLFGLEFIGHCYNQSAKSIGDTNPECGPGDLGPLQGVNPGITGGLVHGKDGGKTPNPEGTGPGAPSATKNKGASSGSSSATTQSNQNNTTPSSTAQGDNKAQAKIEPSPFYDGKLYDAGSDSISNVANVFSTKNRPKTFVIIFIITAIIGVGVVYYIRLRRLKNSVKKRSK